MTLRRRPRLSVQCDVLLVNDSLLHIASLIALVSACTRDAGVVVEALRHIVEADLFADEKASIRRIELRAWRDSPNVLSLCRQAGGVREAILQQSATRDGRPKDQMLIAWVKE